MTNHVDFMNKWSPWSNDISRLEYFIKDKASDGAYPKASQTRLKELTEQVKLVASADIQGRPPREKMISRKDLDHFNQSNELKN